jgi:hypothetical protein
VKCGGVHASINLAFLSHRIRSVVSGTVTRQHVKLRKHQHFALAIYTARKHVSSPDAKAPTLVSLRRRQQPVGGQEMQHQHGLHTRRDVASDGMLPAVGLAQEPPHLGRGTGRVPGDRFLAPVGRSVGVAGRGEKQSEIGTP